ncbi:MAG: hypothetical protein R3A12_07770 [Ignavibacteria bacterium]
MIFSGTISDANRIYKKKGHEAKIASANENKLGVPKESITARFPQIPFSIKQLWFELDDFERQTYLEKG